MVPDPEYLNTAEAKRIAETQDYAVLDRQDIRVPPSRR